MRCPYLRAWTQFHRSRQVILIRRPPANDRRGQASYAPAVSRGHQNTNTVSLGRPARPAHCHRRSPAPAALRYCRLPPAATHTFSVGALTRMARVGCGHRRLLLFQLQGVTAVTPSSLYDSFSVGTLTRMARVGCGHRRLLLFQLQGVTAVTPSSLYDSFSVGIGRSYDRSNPWMYVIL